MSARRQAHIPDAFRRHFLDSVSEHRTLVHAFLITGETEPDVRARTVSTSRTAASNVTEFLHTRFGCDPQAADMAYRVASAYATQAVLFDTATEVSERVVPDERQGALLVNAPDQLVG